MRVLVTGGAGFIGSYVCEALLKNGHEVRVLDNLIPQVHGENGDWPEYLSNKVDRILGDVRDRSIVEKSLEGCDSVIHLAALVGVGQSMYEIENYSSVNVLGTAVLLEEIIKRKSEIKKIIVAGSMSSYGEGAYLNDKQQVCYPNLRAIEQISSKRWELVDDNGSVLTPTPTKESKTLKPQSIYAINKKDQEEMALVIGKAYKIPTIVFRMFNVFGPRQALSNPYTGVVAIFCSRLLNNQSPIIYEDGHQKRDFIYVEDVAQAYLMAIESENKDCLTLNLGSGKSISILEIAETLGTVLNKDIAPTISHKFREGDIRHCFADIDLIKKIFNWKPKWNFKDGIRELSKWLMNKSADDHFLNAKNELLDKGLLK